MKSTMDMLQRHKIRYLRHVVMRPVTTEIKFYNAGYRVQDLRREGWYLTTAHDSRLDKPVVYIWLPQFKAFTDKIGFYDDHEYEYDSEHAINDGV